MNIKWKVVIGLLALPGYVAAEEPAELDTMQIRATGFEQDYFIPNATAATKTDTPIMETPVSIQVIPQAVMEDKQVMTLPDAVNGQVSGVTGRTGGGYLYDNFIIRGFAGTGYGDAYRNGLYNRQNIYDTANIEQIEIIKGPAAVLYGRVEPGGLINYVTKKPQATAYYALQQQIGSYHQNRTSFDATGAVDESGILLYRLTGAYTDNESFRDFVGNERVFVAPSFTLRPNEKFELNVEIEYKHDKFHPDNGIPAIGSRIAPVPLDRSLADGEDRNRIKDKLVSFDWTYHFNDDWKLTHRYQWVDWRLDQKQTSSFGMLDDRTLDRAVLTGWQDVETHSTNLDLNGKFEAFGVKHNVLFGLDAFRAQTWSLGGFDINGHPIDIYNPVYGTVDWDALDPPEYFYRKEWWNGLYFQDQITFGDKLHVLLGGRYDWVSTGFGFSTTSMGEAKDGRRANKDGQFSPRLGVLYDLMPWLSVYGSYSESFGNNNGRSASGSAFDPQQGKQYEVGMKMETLDKRFSSTIALFDLTKDNMLTDDPGNPGFSILAGEVTSQGLEIDASGQITDKFKLLATYALTSVKYTQNNDGLQGNRLENVPIQQGSLWGTYQVNQALRVGLGGVAVGRRPGDNDNTFYMPGYARLDAMAAYTQNLGKSKLTLQVNVNNLTDKDYYANTDASSTTVIPGDPREVMVSARIEY